MMNKKGQMGFSNFVILIIFIVLFSVGGLLAGLLYYDMNLMQSTLMQINFKLPIENNNSIGATNITDFQGILGMTIYPLLGLKAAIPYLTYFMMFAFIIAIGLVAYLSSKNPLFFVLHILFTLLLTYFCIILSNVYIDLLSNVFINSLMSQFTIYNKLMIYLPQVFFFTSLLFGVIAFINLIKPNSNNSMTGLNYGGEY